MKKDSGKRKNCTGSGVTHIRFLTGVLMALQLVFAYVIIRFKGAEDNLTGMLWLQKSSRMITILYCVFSFGQLYFLIRKLPVYSKKLYTAALVLMGTGVLWPYSLDFTGSVHTLICTAGVILWCAGLLREQFFLPAGKAKSAVSSALAADAVVFVLYCIQARVTLEAELLFFAGQSLVFSLYLLLPVKNG